MRRQLGDWVLCNRVDLRWDREVVRETLSLASFGVLYAKRIPYRIRVAVAMARCGHEEVRSRWYFARGVDHMGALGAWVPLVGRWLRPAKGGQKTVWFELCLFFSLDGGEAGRGEALFAAPPLVSCCG